MRLRMTSTVRSSASAMMPATCASMASSVRVSSAALSSPRRRASSICAVKLMPPARSRPSRSFCEVGVTHTTDATTSATNMSQRKIVFLSFMSFSLYSAIPFWVM